MIYIKKSKDNQFYADIISDSNKKKIASTETHTQKHNCWKNIFAIANEFAYSITYIVIDTSGKKEKKYYVYENVKSLIK